MSHHSEGSFLVPGAFKHGPTYYILETAANKSCIYLGIVSRNQTQETKPSKYGRHE